MTKWKAILRGLKRTCGFRSANADAIEKALSGVSVHSGRLRVESGVHAVVNLSSAHAPALFDPAMRADSSQAEQYKNCYDLGSHRVGKPPHRSARQRVDEALPLRSGVRYQSIYFAAAELNGAGVRFYGDYCLVLRNAVVPNHTSILDRNSFEFLLAPFDAKNIKQEMQAHASTWGDVAEVASVKILQSAASTRRRLTTGTISDALLHDEDYIEVLRESSFTADDVLEVRTSPEDAALESTVVERMRAGPAPTIAELQWTQRRRAAARALDDAGCTIRVVATPGRTRA